MVLATEGSPPMSADNARRLYPVVSLIGQKADAFEGAFGPAGNLVCVTLRSTSFTGENIWHGMNSLSRCLMVIVAQCPQRCRRGE